MPDVVCLRPRADFDAVGVTPTEGLDIVYRAPLDADVGDLLATARAVVIPAVGPALAAELFRGTTLQLVQITGAGLDRVDQSVLAAEGIALANVPGGSNTALAEYVTTNALALSRGFFGASGPLRDGDYITHRAAMVAASLRGLGGLTVGLVGLGDYWAGGRRALPRNGCADRLSRSAAPARQRRFGPDQCSAALTGRASDDLRYRQLAPAADRQHPQSYGPR